MTGRHDKVYDLYGVGNALMDLEYRVEDRFLQRHGIAKGHMTLVDEARLGQLSEALADHHPERLSGGSAANTLMAVQGFGGRTFYSCKVAADEVGRLFLRDLAYAGIQVNASANAPLRPSGHDADGDRLTDGQEAAPPRRSGRCLVLITPDAERSMNTFLGVSSTLGADEIDAHALSTTRTLYMEGYLSSSPSSLQAALRARRLAAHQGVDTALSLSDPSIVTFFRDSLESLLGNGVQLLFCNEEEALTWAGTDRLDIAIAELKDIAGTCFITLGQRGSLSVVKGKAVEVGGFAADTVDTTGAGDIYAGAALHGLGIGMEAAQAARFGNYAAAALVQQYGARLRSLDDYRQVLRQFKS